ncbi:MAG: STAS domain-containing protein [Bacteroidales bacterium]|nr:STAS domain-containing protein [Bacteroidales bacterium]
MTLVNIEKNEQLVFRFSHRLDATNAVEVSERIAADLETLGTDVVLDVNGLEYISSAGLQVVLHCAKAAKAAGKEIFLTGAKDNVLEIFRISGFLTFLQLK